MKYGFDVKGISFYFELEQDNIKPGYGIKVELPLELSNTEELNDTQIQEDIKSTLIQYFNEKDTEHRLSLDNLNGVDFRQDDYEEIPQEGMKKKITYHYWFVPKHNENLYDTVKEILAPLSLADTSNIKDPNRKKAIEDFNPFGLMIRPFFSVLPDHAVCQYNDYILRHEYSETAVQKFSKALMDFETAVKERVGNIKPVVGNKYSDEDCKELDKLDKQIRLIEQLIADLNNPATYYGLTSEKALIEKRYALIEQYRKAALQLSTGQKIALAIGAIVIGAVLVTGGILAGAIIGALAGGMTPASLVTTVMGGGIGALAGLEAAVAVGAILGGLVGLATDAGMTGLLRYGFLARSSTNQNRQITQIAKAATNIVKEEKQMITFAITHAMA